MTEKGQDPIRARMSAQEEQAQGTPHLLTRATETFKHKCQPRRVRDKAVRLGEDQMRF